MKNKSVQFKAFLKYDFTHPFFYIVLAIFALVIPINFFIRHQFFNGAGSTDLILLFSVIPYISILLVSVLCFKKSLQNYENFVPLSSFEKSIAKFLACLFEFFILLIFTIPSALSLNFFGNIDYGQLFTSFLCLIFYGAAVIAFCLFIYELIPNVIISLFVSAIFLAIFNFAHLFAVYVELNSFFAAFFRQISFAWHFDAASKGIFDSRDFISLLFSSILFILLTSFVKEIKKGRKLNQNYYFLKNFSVFCVLILIILNGNRYFFRKDFSQGKTYSLSQYSKKLLENSDSPVKITYYRSSSLAKFYPQIRDISDYLTTYANQNKNISFLIQDPDKHSEYADLLQNYGIYGQQMKKQKNNSTEFVNVYSSIIIENKGQYKTIPFLLSTERLEYDLDCKIKNLLSGKSSVINIILGNGKSLSNDYDFVAPWLSSEGFEINEIVCGNSDFSQNLLKTNGPLFVIGDSEININDAIAIENYILSGKGNAFFNVSPFSVNIDSDWQINRNSRTNIVEMLENWGIRFTEAVAADYSCNQITMYSQNENQNYSSENVSTEIINYPLWISLQPQTNALQGANVFWAVPLEIVSENVNPYLISSKMAWNFETDKNQRENLVQTDPFVIKTYDFSTYEKKTLILGAEINGKISGLYNEAENSDCKIIVIPDQYFVNSLMNGYIGGEGGDYRNYDLMTEILLHLDGEDDLKILHSKKNRDTSLYKITDEQSFNLTQKKVYILLFAFIPLLIIAVFVFVKILEKKARSKKYEK
jgi:ABC-type uncharacterized transport system involved in gliding motility auxiliary subunit